uniref:G-protein coupled receptor 12-like n=1 Tax=Serinus canaria TaxID=9135 RepID=A0A8C9MFI1_SERCA
MWLLCLGVGLLPLLATPRCTPTRWRCPPPATRSSTPSFTPSETRTSRSRSGWPAAGASLPPRSQRRSLALLLLLFFPSVVIVSCREESPPRSAHLVPWKDGQKGKRKEKKNQKRKGKRESRMIMVSFRNVIFLHILFFI